MFWLPPKSIIPLGLVKNQHTTLKKGSCFSVLSFNIGYCGLDQNQDFFMDGGQMSRSKSLAQTTKNLHQITSFLSEHTPDLILLQEVDIRSSRSHLVNQFTYLTSNLPNYGSTFGYNHHVRWVPVPVFHPMGSVYSGLATLSQYHISSAVRCQYPGRENWLRQMFDLDRCLVEVRLPVEEGQDLILINSHLSAFDRGGQIRQKQLEFLQAHIIQLYRDGHYVIVGGDWNHVLPETDPSQFPSLGEWPDWLHKIPNFFKPEGFYWAVDPSIPTVRTVDKPYREGINFTAVIDGFLISSNIEVNHVCGHQLNFAHSDHNPVTGCFSLKK